MFQWLKTRRQKKQARNLARAIHERVRISAASKLADPAEPKVKPKQQSIPSYLATAKPNTNTALPRTDRALANKNLNDYRLATNDRQLVRDYASTTPDLSAAVFAYCRLAITDSYTAVAYNRDGTFSPEGTALAMEILARFDVLHDYSDGFSGISSMRTNSEMFVKELMFYGACAGELVLGKDRLPRTLAPVSVSEIDFYPDKSGQGLAPKQRKSGVTIDLDIPTFFYVSLDQDLLDPYATSPLMPAVQPTIASTEFQNDLRKVTKRVVQPRMVVTINEEKFREYCPAEILQDADKLREHMQAVIEEVRTTVDGLSPEDALVLFDTVGIDLLNNGNITLNKEWEVLNNIHDAKMSTGAKTLPSILGHGSESQNVASTETMLFMKNAAGLQFKLNEIYSRALTLAVRLFGVDVYIDFKYQAIDLRPEAELEAFRAMRQERILELWSLGVLTDEQASIELTGRLPNPGMPKLSGTGFHQSKATDPGNPFSGTSTGPGGGALNQSLKSKAPQQPKGPSRAHLVDMTSALN